RFLCDTPRPLTPPPLSPLPLPTPLLLILDTTSFRHFRQETQSRAVVQNEAIHRHGGSRPDRGAGIQAANHHHHGRSMHR
ncbi:unnamed protein product, partial [Scytosiphon promiscuus]